MMAFLKEVFLLRIHAQCSSRRKNSNQRRIFQTAVESHKSKVCCGIDLIVLNMLLESCYLICAWLLKITVRYRSSRSAWRSCWELSITMTDQYHKTEFCRFLTSCRSARYGIVLSSWVVSNPYRKSLSGSWGFFQGPLWLFFHGSWASHKWVRGLKASCNCKKL